MLLGVAVAEARDREAEAVEESDVAREWVTGDAKALHQTNGTFHISKFSKKKKGC